MRAKCRVEKCAGRGNDIMGVVPVVVLRYVYAWV